MVADRVPQNVTDRYRLYGKTRHGVCDGLRPAIWVIGKVELDSTFPTITTTPTKKDFNGNVCLVRSAASDLGARESRT